MAEQIKEEKKGRGGGGKPPFLTREALSVE
jgi:hypothetical protein